MIRAPRSSGSRSSLDSRIALLVLAPFLAAMVEIVALLYFLSQTASAPSHINVCGRQRMLAVQLGDWADMVASGQDEDRDRLVELAADFDAALVALDQGGEVDGRWIDPLPAKVRRSSEGLRADWAELEKRLLVIAHERVDSPRFAVAYRDLDLAIEELRSRSDTLTAEVEAATLALRRRLLATFCAGAVFDLALVGFALWYAHRSVIRPVRAIELAANRVAAGEYTVRLPDSRDDELGRLARAFNDMATCIQASVEAVDERRKHAEILIDSLPVGTVLLDQRFSIVVANERFLQMVALDRPVVRGRPIEDVLSVGGLDTRMRTILSTGAPGIPFDVSGSRPLRITAVPTRLTDDNCFMVVVVEDLTEQARLRSEAQESEDRFRIVVEVSPDPIAVHRNGRFVYVNPALVAALGYERDAELIGTPVFEAVHPDERGELAIRIRDVLVTGVAAPPRETRLLRRDGSVLVAETVGMKVVFGGEPASLVIARDLTERKRLMATTMHMDRMMAIGTLAAGIAHEINTPVQYVSDSLNFLQGCAQDVFFVLERLEAVHNALLEEVSPSAAVAAASEAISESDLQYIRENVPDAFERCLGGLNRVAEIVRSMKEFAHPTAKDPAPVDLNRLIHDTLVIARSEYKYVADVETEYAELPPVTCMASDVSQVLLNVVVNAAQAIAEKRPGDGRKGMIKVRTCCDGDTVRMSISDTGRGIPEEIRGRIFDPFFTTKEVGKGTGQGLALAWSIINERHGGEISFETTVGAGTTFFITLPIAGRPHPNATDERPTA